MPASGTLAGLVAVLLSLQAAGAAESDSNYSLTGILDGLLHNYDKRVRPNYGGQPVDVDVSMYVLDISTLSDKDMEYTIDFYLRHYWTDPRLRYTERPGMETISLGPSFGDRIWVPDTFIVNEKRSQPSNPLSHNEFFRVTPSGSVLRSYRMSVTVSCPMSLQYFPLDQQMCAIEFESYGYSMKDIRYKWKDGSDSVGVSYSISLPQFSMIGYRTKAMEISLTSGNYSRMYCEFQFARAVGYYLIQIYIPAALIVVISWATFWLERGTARTTRVTLGAITVLTMTALMTFTNADIPKVSYLKAIDVYIGFCFFMVFAALIEYTAVCYLMKRLQANKARLQAIQQIAEEHSKEVRFEVTKCTAASGTANGLADEEALTAGLKEEKLYGVAPSTLDKYSRILFPIVFICFNLIYWVIYLHIGGVPAKDLILV